MTALGEGSVWANIALDKVEGVTDLVVHGGFGMTNTLEEVVSVNVDGFAAFAGALLGDR